MKRYAQFIGVLLMLPLFCLVFQVGGLFWTLCMDLYHNTPHFVKWMMAIMLFASGLFLFCYWDLVHAGRTEDTKSKGIGENNGC